MVQKCFETFLQTFTCSNAEHAGAQITKLLNLLEEKGHRFKNKQPIFPFHCSELKQCL